MGTHYVCRGECKAVSDEEGSCSSDSCSMHGQKLEICPCTDGSHSTSPMEMGADEA